MVPVSSVPNTPIIKGQHQYMWSKLTGRLLKLAQNRVISGYSEYCSKPTNGRALLSFLVPPLLPPPRWRDHVRFSLRGVAQEIPRALNELGYIVDIIHCTNVTWHPTRKYDLFVGHGGINYESISRSLPGSVTSIYFATGLYWRENNLRLAKRIYNLTERRGCLLPGYRAVQYDEEYANQTADGIICLGNHNAVQTFGKFTRVIGINNGIYPIQWNGWRDRDHEEGRKHFLFFSGNGSVLKGLDLLIEAFAKTDLHLHICQRPEADFLRIYRGEFELPNIHLHGFIKMRSPEFEALAQQCNWVISATSTDGQPGAILECMGHGMVPILPDSANIDLGDWGIRLADCDVETIYQTIRAVSTMDPSQCRLKADKVVETTRDSYSADNFRVSFRQAVADIVAAANLMNTQVS
jgi:glycosyltransferase involved in cell wall biosynthesis